MSDSKENDQNKEDININNESINNISENLQTQNQTQSLISNQTPTQKNQNLITNESQTSFTMNNKEKDKENIIEMIYIIDKDKNFEETNILNTFDIKLNVHIDHTQKDKLFFFDYDVHEEGSFNEKKNNIYKFKCSDSKCNAIYHLTLLPKLKENNQISNKDLNMNDLTGKENTNNTNEEENQLFSKVKDHTLAYEQHDYIIKPTKGQNKYQEILMKYPNIKHVQVISVPDNFDYSTIPNTTLNISDPEQNDDEYINVEENEDEKYSLESEIYDKNNKIDKDEDDDYYSNTSSYKARSRNKDGKKKIK
jgi:hypothetical protein